MTVQPGDNSNKHISVESIWAHCLLFQYKCMLLIYFTVPNFQYCVEVLDSHPSRILHHIEQWPGQQMTYCVFIVYFRHTVMPCSTYTSSQLLIRFLAWLVLQDVSLSTAETCKASQLVPAYSVGHMISISTGAWLQFEGIWGPVQTLPARQNEGKYHGVEPHRAPPCWSCKFAVLFLYRVCVFSLVIVSFGI